jgi:Mg2+-importing ATPase
LENEYYFWSAKIEEVFQVLRTSHFGLSTAEAIARKTKPVKEKSAFHKRAIMFFSQFKNPLTLLLIFALLLSSLVGEYVDAAIIFTILFVSALLTFLQESKAGVAVEKLRFILRSKSMVMRNGKAIEISREDVVRGDIVLLKAGNIVPADALIIASEDL